ncbi:MAG: hypothetical protein KZQ92_17965, partial [Candidatus Thiodiazotropha sp. (ex Lucinoma borealis)]|nr:hypothetical protein [Candidatus Thiodiazotropha sp. (ex Lucinoma borealis)]
MPPFRTVDVALHSFDEPCLLLFSHIHRYIELSWHMLLSLLKQRFLSPHLLQSSHKSETARTDDNRFWHILLLTISTYLPDSFLLKLISE